MYSGSFLFTSTPKERNLSMKCKCGQEMKVARDSMVFLGDEIQLVLHCKKCNKFNVVAYATPVVVKVFTEEEYYGKA